MSAAALALSMAVLFAPAPARPRALALMPRGTSARLRLPPGPVVVVALAVPLLLLPASVVLAAGLVVATLWWLRRSAGRRRSSSQEAAALQDALDVLVGELRVGVHPVTAVGSAAAEARGSVARSLSAVAARAVLGADVAAGLRAEARKSCAPGSWERLAVCWQLAHEHGLAVATLMRTAQHDIGERARFGSRVEAGMAGARATAAILAALPLLGLVLGQALGADPLVFLTSGGAGGALLVIGAALICCGLLWSDSILARVLK